MSRYKKGRVLKEKLHNWILKMLVIIEKVIILIISNNINIRYKAIMVKKIYMINTPNVVSKRLFLK